MNIYLNNDVISDLSLTDSEIGVYVALRNIYLSNRDYQVVTFNMIAYELFGNKDYKRAIFESIKSSFKSLVDKEIITIIDELSSTEFVVNLSKLYINMENEDTYYTIIKDNEVHTIMNINSKIDKFKLLRYFIICMKTICRTTGVYKDCGTKQNFVGFMTQEYLCSLIGISHDTNSKLIQTYNSVLEENKLLYIYRHTEMKRDKKTGQIKSFANHYGRYEDKDDIEIFALNYEKTCGAQEEIVQSDK